MSPLEITLLMHCYAIPRHDSTMDVPAGREALCRFVNEGLIHSDQNGIWHTTERGTAHVKQLCNLPLPETAWVDQSRKEIK